MRILHTADLHLGHSLNGWDRTQEHSRWFDQLAEVVQREEIDLLLIAGDVFDNTNPSGEIQRLLYRGLMQLRAVRPDLRIVISGGNHDPARRLEAPAALMELHGMHVVGSVHRGPRAADDALQGGQGLDLDHHLVPIRGRDGAVALYVLAVPFLRASDLPGLSFDAAQDETGESPIIAAARRFFDAVTQAALGHMAGQGHGDLPLIMTAHLHCAGGIESEGAERRIIIGGNHAVPWDVFPDTLSYVALGHLHRPQSLAGGRVRYCGSCFPLSASEIGYDHGVTLLEVTPGSRSVTPRHLSLPRPVPVLRLPGAGSGAQALLIDELDAALATVLEQHVFTDDTPMGLRPFVYLEMQASDAASVIMTEAATRVKQAGLRLAGIRVRRGLSDPAAGATGSGAVTQTLADTTPEALFVAAYQKKNGIDPEDRHLAVFREAVTDREA